MTGFAIVAGGLALYALAVVWATHVFRPRRRVISDRVAERDAVGDGAWTVTRAEYPTARGAHGREIEPRGM